MANPQSEVDHLRQALADADVAVSDAWHRLQSYYGKLEQQAAERTYDAACRHREVIRAHLYAAQARQIFGP